ncbi:YtxH domain-containing protein [Heyndrickxia sp. MSNUG]|uniref:YtxH domain-containing protein n=1 Tax=Heyndrickxia sp. MSNUG TaxID=3136677 RepID=UPI003C2E5A52
MVNREQNQYTQYDPNNSMRESSSNSRDFVTGAIVGGLAGALAALLLAPKTGKELRGSLNEQTTTLKSKGIDLASVAKEKASGLKETVSQQSSTIVNKVKDMKNQQNAGTASQTTEADFAEEGELQEVPTSMAETSSMDSTHTATGEEIQKKLEETQKAFDDTESKLNQ